MLLNSSKDDIYMSVRQLLKRVGHPGTLHKYIGTYRLSLTITQMYI